MAAHISRLPINSPLKRGEDDALFSFHISDPPEAKTKSHRRLFLSPDWKMLRDEIALLISLCCSGVTSTCFAASSAVRDSKVSLFDNAENYKRGGGQ